MAKGFTGTILKVDLTEGKTERLEMSDEFYRTYMGGSGFGAYFLLKELKKKTDPFAPENRVTIAPGITTGAAVSGVSRCCITALSPETGGVGDSQLGGNIGPMIKRAGYDGIMITGKAAGPSYLLVDGDNVEIKDAAQIHGKTVLEAHDALTGEHGDKKISILQ